MNSIGDVRSACHQTLRRLVLGWMMFVGMSVAQAAVLDLDGDGRSDLLTQDGNGVLVGRVMKGGAITTTGTLLAAGSQWVVTHSADFDGDGKADLLFRNVADGSVVIYLMNGLTVQSTATVLGTSSVWVVAEVADFNGDGKADLLWRNQSDNSHGIWLMNGTATLASSSIIGPGDWVVTQTADFNGDGKADLLWRNLGDGSYALWLMNGMISTSVSGLLGSSDWVVTQSADFNGDGKSDLLWRKQSDGSTALWLMNGTSMSGAAGLLGPSSWMATHVGDLNGDGKADIVWRNRNDGMIAAWLMNGLNPIGGASSAVLLGANSGWQVQSLLDVNGDNKSDLVWRHSDGTIALWVMNGVTRTAAAFIAGGNVAGSVLDVVPRVSDILVSPLSAVKWSQAATWGGTLPRAGDAVTIPAGKHILLDVSPPALKSLLIEGQLSADPGKDLNLTADWIIVNGTNAKFNIGSETQPYTKRATITLTGTNTAENIMGMGTKVLGVMGGRLELYGQTKRSWTRLAATAPRGAAQLALADSLEGWQVGDEIAIAPSDFEALESEKRTIIAMNSRTVVLDRPLDFDHWGAVPQGYGNKFLDMRAEVGNLSRNIVIRSAQNEERLLPGFDPQSRTPEGRQNGDGKRLEMGRFGGHMMFMPGSKVYLQNIEVTGMGQQGMLGRYPVHWHLNQDASTGNFIRNSTIHDTFQRGLVIHQSNGVRAEGNVIFNTPGHAVFLEDGVERNNVLTDNLVMSVTYVLRKHRLSLKDDENANRAERQSGFWITNPQNVVRGNVVAGVENG
jgi:G8 domain/FG-GAP-like repeat/Right handed beta helix region